MRRPQRSGERRAVLALARGRLSASAFTWGIPRVALLFFRKTGRSPQSQLPSVRTCSLHKGHEGGQCDTPMCPFVFQVSGAQESHAPDGCWAAPKPGGVNLVPPGCRFRCWCRSMCRDVRVGELVAHDGVSARVGLGKWSSMFGGGDSSQASAAATDASMSGAGGAVTVIVIVLACWFVAALGLARYRRLRQAASGDAEPCERHSGSLATGRADARPCSGLKNRK